MPKSVFSRILRLLAPDERRKIVRVSLSVFANALLDFLGIATLLPILYYLIEGSGHREAALVFCAIAISICLIKYLAATRLSKYQNRFLLGLYKRLSYSLYSSYYRRGLLFIRRKGVSRIGYDINVICFAFSQSVLAPMLKIAGDALLIILAMIAVLVYSPVIAAVLLASFLPFVLIYVFVIRKRAKECGRMEQKAKREQAQLVHDSFGGYVDLQLNDAFTTFSRQFQNGMDTIAESRLKMNNVQRLPLFLSEIAVVLGLAALCLFSVGDISILIGIFAVAAFRLLPAMRSILSSWTVIQNAEEVLGILEDGLCEDTDEGTKEITFESEIEFRNLSYSYPDGEEVFRNFNLIIRKGEYIGFRGDSGAGKSTLFNLLLGFISPTEGEILIDGHILEPRIRKSWLEKIGYVAQDVFIFNSSIAENIAMGSEADEKRLADILESLNMGEWLKEQADGLHTLISERGETLSGGQRQRIGIARAIYRNVSILLLDEASSSIDNETERDLLAILDKLRNESKNLTLLSIAHRDSSLANCDKIVNI